MAAYKKGQFIGEKLLIHGPAGKIQVQTSYPKDFLPDQPLMIISHPHPLYGGNMTNKVVYNLAKAFNEKGYASIRFNFRGVQQSEGVYDQGNGEVDDLAAVFQFFAQRHPDAPIALGGFSFGAYITARAQSSLSPAAVLLVAPPVSMYDFSDLSVVARPWMVIQGGQDEIVDPEQVTAWVEKQPNKPGYYCLTTADHFFHGKLEWLRGVINSEWKLTQE